MVDAADLKSATFTGVWVRIPPSAPKTTEKFVTKASIHRKGRFLSKRPQLYWQRN